MRPTQICITTDTEFSIAGHFKCPEQYFPVAEPAVYGEVDGREEALGFMLETFDRYDISSSFFIECANYYYFGDEPMQGITQRILSAGQDVQLHVHPIWLHFNQDPDIGSFPRHDDCAGRSYDDLFRAFSLCRDVFRRWTGKDPLALRTGSLSTDENVYRVMHDLGIKLSSNIGMGIVEHQQPLLRHNSGRHSIHGVMELPILTYQDMSFAGRKHWKSLQITSCSWPEMRHILWQARKLGVENIVILTHPFEFIKRADFQYRKLTRNRINQNRLKKLCAFIRQHDQDFVATSFSEQCRDWTASELLQQDIKVPGVYALGRKLHNRLNDTIWSY